MDPITVATDHALCPGCFAAKGGANPCPHCGYDERAPRNDFLLPHRMLLHGQYLIGRVLGKPGGFGITYLGWDQRLETRVAIKEYLPREWAGRATDGATVKSHVGEEGEWFRYGLDRFLGEARTLARIDHPNIVRVRYFFEANGTAYLVMDYYQGLTLAEYLERQGGRLPEARALQLMLPILEGLRALHAKGFLHRDIKPQNIYLADTEGGAPRPILLDFGAARQAMGGHARTMTVVYTTGYAPIEQYHEKGKQGPWTDLYSVAAVLYCLVTGQSPPESIARLSGDKLKPAADFGVSKPLSDTLAAGLAIRPEDRPQTVQAFQAQLAQTLRQERPSARRHWRWAAALVPILAALLGLDGWYQYRETRLHEAADQRAFAAALTVDTDPAYRNYLNTCAPDGCGHRAEAQGRLAAVAARALQGQSAAPEAAAATPTPPVTGEPPTAAVTGPLQDSVTAGGADPDARPVDQTAPGQPPNQQDIRIGKHHLLSQVSGMPAARPTSPPPTVPSTDAPAPTTDPSPEQALALTPAQCRDLQARLAALGYYPLDALDDEFGTGAREALRNWQRATGLPDSGYLDRAQLERLRSAADPTQVQRIHWDSIHSTTSIATLAGFLSMYPDGQYAEAARARIGALGVPQQRQRRSARTWSPAPAKPYTGRAPPAPRSSPWSSRRLENTIITRVPRGPVIHLPGGFVTPAPAQRGQTEPSAPAPKQAPAATPQRKKKYSADEQRAIRDFAAPH